MNMKQSQMALGVPMVGMSKKMIVKELLKNLVSQESLRLVTGTMHLQDVLLATQKTMGIRLF